MEEKHILGIDFGTSNSCLAIWYHSKPLIINDIDGSEYIPSIIEFSSNKKIIGYDAYMRKNIFDNNLNTFTVYEIKKLLGKKFSEISNEYKNNIGFSITSDENDNILIFNAVNNTYHTPEEIAIHMFMSFKAYAEQKTNLELNDCVISVPAYFNKNQREIIKLCATSANFNVLRMINEPTAAAIAYGIHNKKSKKILVYDLGGGTLDISIVELEDNIFQVLGSNGNSQLGGSDFDQVIINYCIDEFKNENELNELEISNTNLQKLKYLAEQAKKTLSEHSSANIFIKNFYNNVDLKINITRELFYHITSFLIELLTSPLPDLLELCEVTKEDIDDIILVGGMTNMPIVKTNLEKFFHKKITSTIDPNNVVAIGAAIHGWMIQNKKNIEDNIVLIDRTSLSIGIETSGGIMDILIPRGTIMPCKKTKKYTTDTDNMEEIEIKIFEGERKLSKDNFLIGDFTLGGIEPEKRGLPEIEITFKVDTDGIIKISAMDIKNPLNKNTLCITSNRKNLSNDQITEIINKAVEMDKIDREIKYKKESNSLIKNMCSTILENIIVSDIDNKKKEEIQETIKKILDQVEPEYELIEIETYKEIIDNIKNNYSILLLDVKNATNELETNEVSEKKEYDSIYDENNNIDKIEEYKEMYATLTKIKNKNIKSLEMRINNLLDELNDILIKLFTNIPCNEIDISGFYHEIIEEYNKLVDNNPINSIIKKLEELEDNIDEKDIASQEKLLDYIEYIYIIQNGYKEYNEDDDKLKEIINFINNSI